MTVFGLFQAISCPFSLIYVSISRCVINPCTLEGRRAVDPVRALTTKIRKRRYHEGVN